MLLCSLLLATAASAQTCDPSCLTCSQTTRITAVPCDTSSAAQRGWSLSPAEGTTNTKASIAPPPLMAIAYRGALSSGCVSWYQNTGTLEVRPCAARDGAEWTNATARACQRWDVTALGTFGPIHGGPGCDDNEGRPGPAACLDVHSKVGPAVELTHCYGQPNDNFTVGADGRWRSQGAPPTFPPRCMAVSAPAPCPFAGCCTACAPGRHFSPDGFCVRDAPLAAAPAPAAARKVYVWLAADINATGDDAALDALVPHTGSFSGVVFQYWSICGAGAAPGSCTPEDSVGPARLRPTWSGGHYPPADLAARLRSRLGAGKDAVAAISFGGSQSHALLVGLFRNASLTAGFTRDVIEGCKAQNLTGVNFDLEPFGTGADGWFVDAAAFFATFSAALRAEGLTVGWDGNGPEGVFLDVDTWMDMATYTYQSGSTSFSSELKKGVFAIGPERFAVGLCPTCAAQNESAVAGNFADLQREGGPGTHVTKMHLFSFYGEGDQPPAGWAPFWSRVKAWLEN